jgi:hypothetical protein
MAQHNSLNPQKIDLFPNQSGDHSERRLDSVRPEKLNLSHMDASTYKWV